MPKVFSFFIFVCSVFILPLSTFASDSWPIDNGTPELTSFNRTTLSNELFLKHDMDLPSMGNPKEFLVNGDNLYSLDSSGSKLSAYSLETKAVKWDYTPANNLPILRIAIVNGNIIVVTNSSTYFVKDEGSNKSIIWEAKVTGGWITYDSQNLYIAYQGYDIATIQAVSLSNGASTWLNTLPANHRIISKISASINNVFLITDYRIEANKKLFAVSKQNGQTLWTSSFGDFATVPLIQGDKVFVEGQSNIMAFLASNGTYSWRKSYGESYGGTYDNAISANGDTIFTRTQSGFLLGINANNGEVRFKSDFRDYETGSYLTSSRGPILVTSNQVILENNGKIKFFNSSTGVQVHTLVQPGAKIEPVLATDHYLITKASDKLYVFAPPVDQQYKDPDGNVGPEQPPAPDPVPPNQMIYVVKAGDTLWKIANNLGTTVQQIRDLNHLDPNAYLWVGQNLTVPKPLKTYTVQAGDTLWKIAAKYGTTVKALMDANKLAPNSYIWVGQKLIIPETATIVPTPLKTYTVQAGDTLWKIASQNGTTTKALVEKNQLDPTKYLYVGQKLILP
jgi:LysM repeat protein